MSPVSNGISEGDGYLSEDLKVDPGKFSLDSLDLGDDSEGDDNEEAPAESACDKCGMCK